MAVRARGETHAVGRCSFYPRDTASAERTSRVVAIDESGTWWRGENIDDLVEYLERYTAEGYPATDIRESVCGTCGGRVFGLRADQDEGCARRTCRACGNQAFLVDR